MAHYDYEESCISHILSMNNVKYLFGLLGQRGLFVNGEWLLSINYDRNRVQYGISYNVKTKECNMCRKKNGGQTFFPIVNPNKRSDCVVDKSNSGIRIEGTFLNESPFGYVCIINESNELTYKGVMIGESKECFGIEFFPDLGKVEYIGCYWNNMRHGFGMLYDRKGELMYEGDWLYGSSDFETSVVLQDIRNGRMVHSLIHELVIAEGCNNDYKGDLLLCGFDSLERLVVKKNSFRKVNSLKIHDNCVLKSIEIENGEGNNGAFCDVKSVLLRSASMLID